MTPAEIDNNINDLLARVAALEDQQSQGLAKSQSMELSAPVEVINRHRRDD